MRVFDLFNISMNIVMKGTGSAVPKRRVTNEELGRMVDTSDEWIMSRTGIRARHIAVEETTTSLAVEAAEKALDDADVKAEEIDLIIASTVTPDQFLPNLACEVQAAIGAKNAAAFDVNAACSGFLFALNTAAMYLKGSGAKTALIVGAETLSKIVDWKDRSTCVLFGDGAGAAVIRAEELDVCSGILSMVQGSDGTRGGALKCGGRPLNNPFVTQQAAQAYVSMDGQEVYRFAVRTVPKVIRQAADEAGMSLDEIDLFLLHQANVRIIEAAAKQLSQPMEKFPVNLPEYGNLSAASVPVLLDYVRKQGRIQSGSRLVLAGFGAGMTWSGAVVVW